MRIRQEGGDWILDWNTASSYTVLTAAALGYVAVMVVMALGIGPMLSAHSVTAESARAHRVLVTKGALISMLSAGLLAAWVAGTAFRVRLRVRGRTLSRSAPFGRSEDWPLENGGEVLLTRRVIPGKASRERWGVRFRSGAGELLVGEKDGAEVEARRVAECLAKQLRVPMRYDVGGRTVAILPEDLDLPFVERVRKYEALRVAPLAKPRGSRVAQEHGAEGQTFRWNALTPGTAAAVLGATALVILAAGSKQPQLIVLAVDHWPWIVILAGGLLATLGGLWFHLLVGPARVEYRIRFFGLPLSSREIPTSELEDVRPTRVVYTPVLQLVSDRGIVNCKVYDWTRRERTIAWLAFEAQQALGA